MSKFLPYFIVAFDPFSWSHPGAYFSALQAGVPVVESFLGVILQEGSQFCVEGGLASVGYAGRPGRKGVQR